MKKRIVALWRRVRGNLATVMAFAVVLGVPLYSLSQYSQLFQQDSRSFNALPQFQTRTTDQNTSPYKLFNEPLISVTFDDGWEVTYADAMPLLHKYGIHTTQYVLSGVEKNQDYLSWDQIANMQNAGHEIGCHSDTHADLRLLDDKKLKTELTSCKEQIEKRYGYVRSFASPYGSVDNRTLKDIKNLFSSHRNTNADPTNGVTEDDVNLAQNFDQYKILGFTIERNTTIKQIQDMVDFTVQNNGWLVLTYHQADDGGSKYGINTTDLSQQLEVLNKSPARIVTVDQALSSRTRN